MAFLIYLMEGAMMEFEQDVFIQAKLDTVRNFLADLKNYEKFHPLIIGIQLIGTKTMSDGTEGSFYHVRDRMKLGPIITAFTYQVVHKVDADGNLVSETFQSPRIFLFNVTRLLPEGQGTRVREAVKIEAPRFLRKIVYKKAIEAHREMLENLKKQME
jgi:hypothetical protein